MKILRIALQRETAAPVLALTFASAVSVALVIARIAWTGQVRYGFLVWNLFLAWLPLIFALLAYQHYRKRPRPGVNRGEPMPGPPINPLALSPSPCDEGAGREPERGAASKKGPPLPSPLLHFAEERERTARARVPLGGVKGGLFNRNWRFIGLTAAWLLFFPNAPYIFTDVIHLTNRYFAHFWVDLMLVLLCALTGLVLGFVSLYLMQSVVARMFGRVASWLFIAVVAGLSSFGVYLGRFVRVNSWDLVARPGKLYHGINAWAADPFAHATSFAFPALFATFLFITYVMLYALTHLPQACQMVLAPEAEEP
jgi:uncharacterized membrane protein